MKRDLDLIRRIVLAAEDAKPYLDHLEGVDNETFAEHVALLKDAGFVEAKVLRSGGMNKAAVLLRLTWEGAQFSAALRDDTLWAKVRDKYIKPSAVAGLGAIWDWLKTELAKQLPSLGS